jgi:hypothetical protein
MLLLLLLLLFLLGLFLIVLNKNIKRHKVLNKLYIFTRLPLETTLQNNAKYKDQKDAFLNDFKHKFKCNIRRRNECILKIFKKKANKKDNDILNMSESELLKTMTPYLNDMNTCQDDNQLKFIMMFISQNICYVDRNKLFEFVKKHVRNQDNIKDVFDKFLIDNNCCESGYKNCGNGCINIMNDVSNCGQCGNTCMIANQTCVQGNCVCPSGQTLCGSSCVDTTNNPSNCGVCGKSCQSNICSKSVCKPYYGSIVATNTSTSITIPIQPPSQIPNLDDDKFYRLNLISNDGVLPVKSEIIDNVKFINNSTTLNYALPAGTNSVNINVYEYNPDGNANPVAMYTGEMDVNPPAPGPP